MQYSWITWVIVCNLAVAIGYYRLWLSQVVRSKTAGLSRITTSSENNTESYEFINEEDQSIFAFKDIVYAQGLCGNLGVPPSERPCTPPLHIHLNQTERFIVLQGQIGYQLGDEIYSCNVETCPRPLVIPPGLKHTFWMDDNKEDLIVRIELEPTDPDYGIRRAFFENFGGLNRDDQVDIFQIFVLFDQAQVYPGAIPLPLAQILFKLGAYLGRALGYKSHYDEYTTTNN